MSRFVHYFLKEQTYFFRFFKKQFKIYNLQLTDRRASAEGGTGAFLQFSKAFFLVKSMPGHIAENTYTFILMNTERTYNIRTDSPANGRKEETKRGDEF